MKVEQLVEQRIEKSLELEENTPHYTKIEVIVLNTESSIVPAEWFC